VHAVETTAAVGNRRKHQKGVKGQSPARRRLAVTLEALLPCGSLRVAAQEGDAPMPDAVEMLNGQSRPLRVVDAGVVEPGAYRSIYGVRGSEFGVQGLRFGVQGLRFGVRGRRSVSLCFFKTERTETVRLPRSTPAEAEP
jgi:hypothetical protein